MLLELVMITNNQGLETTYRRQTRTRMGAQLRRDTLRSVESRRTAAATTGERGGAGMETKQQGPPLLSLVHNLIQTRQGGG